MNFNEYHDNAEPVSQPVNTVKKDPKIIYHKVKEYAKKTIAWLEEKNTDWKGRFDWEILGVAFFLFLCLLFFEALYIYFFNLKFYGIKFLFLLIYSILFSWLLSLVKQRWLRRVLLLLLVVLMCALYYGEASYFAVFKMFALWSQANRLNELTELREQVGTFMNEDFYTFFTPIVFLLLYYFCEAIKVLWHGQPEDRKSLFTFKQKSLGALATFLALMLATFICAYGRGDMNKLYLKNTVAYVDRYGLIDAFFLNSAQSILPIFHEPEPTPEEIEREFGIVDAKNAHTDAYKDKNLIFIEGESIAPYAIDPVLTPTLYRMQTEGYSFDNYYSPRANTLQSEYALMNSFYLTPEKEKEPYSDKYSIAGLFKKKNYGTYFFHDFYGYFYDRDKKIPQAGFDEFYDVYDLNIDFTWPEFPNDVELFTNSFSHIAEKNRFLAYYVTMSGHAGYEIQHRPSLQANFERVKERFPDYDERVQTYLAAAMVTDQGVKQLYDDLARTNKLENTVIVFVGDHYSYGVEDEVLQKTFNISREIELYKTPFFIWDHSHPAEVRNDLMSNVDVLPTLANLFGLDLAYGMGQDMFSDRVKDVIVEWYDFRTYSFLTPQGGYDGLLDEVIGDLTPGQINELQQRSYRRETLNNSRYLRTLLSNQQSQSAREIENKEAPKQATA